MWYKLPHIVQSHTNSHTWYRLSGVVQTLTTGTNCDVQYRLTEPTEVWAEGMFCHLESLTCFLPSGHITTTTTLVTLHMSPWTPTLPPVPSHKLSPVGFAYDYLPTLCSLSPPLPHPSRFPPQPRCRCLPPPPWLPLGSLPPPSPSSFSHSPPSSPAAPSCMLKHCKVKGQPRQSVWLKFNRAVDGAKCQGDRIVALFSPLSRRSNGLMTSLLCPLSCIHCPLWACRSQEHGRSIFTFFLKDRVKLNVTDLFGIKKQQDGVCRQL